MFEHLDELKARADKGYERPLILINYIMHELDREIRVIADVAYPSFGEAVQAGEARDVWAAFDLIEQECNSAVEKLLQFLKDRKEGN